MAQLANVHFTARQDIVEWQGTEKHGSFAGLEGIVDVYLTVVTQSDNSLVAIGLLDKILFTLREWGQSADHSNTMCRVLILVLQ